MESTNLTHKYIELIIRWIRINIFRNITGSIQYRGSVEIIKFRVPSLETATSFLFIISTECTVSLIILPRPQPINTIIIIGITFSAQHTIVNGNVFNLWILRIVPIFTVFGDIPIWNGKTFIFISQSTECILQFIEPIRMPEQV